MKRGVKITTVGALLFGGVILGFSPQLLPQADAENPPNKAVPPAAVPAGSGTDAANISPSRAAREEKNIQDARRQQLAEKEAALAVKEQELKKLSDKIESQIKALEESKKRLDDGIKAQAAAQKKLQDEKMQKMVKLFKTMRGEQAGKLIDSMQEDLALALMSRMDTKSIAKLAPFINHPRVLKWVSENIRGQVQ